jgi:serine/threonine protein kinase
MLMPRTSSTPLDHQTALARGPAPYPSNPQLLGGKYRLLDRLGPADHVEVYKAQIVGAEGFERTVMVRRIPRALMQDPESVRTFVEDAKTAVGLQHENLARILDLGILDGSYFVALDFVDGYDLGTIFHSLRARGHSMPVALVCYAIMQLCDGLDYVHNQESGSGRELRLVRRALCPRDVMVGYEGEVKLIDVGVFPADETLIRTHPGIGQGVPGYLSPEQVHGTPVDHRSDIFVLGIIFYEMLTGERLFAGENDFSAIEKVLNTRIAVPSSINAAVSPDLDRIALKALAPDVAERYPTASSLRTDIEHSLRAQGAAPARCDLADWMKLTFGTEQELDGRGLACDQDGSEGDDAPTSAAVATVPTAGGSFLVDEDAETLVSAASPLPGTEPTPPATSSAKQVTVPPLPRSEAISRLDALSIGPGRPATQLSLPVPQPAPPPGLPPGARDARRVPEDNAWSAGPAAGSTSSPPLFPGMPIALPPGRGAGSPSRRWHPRAPRLRYVLAFVGLLLVGGFLGYLLAPRSGMVQLQVKPADASVTVDGVPIKAISPFRIDRPAGAHQLRIVRPGYAPLVQKIWIGAGQRGHLEVALRPAASTGFELTSNPPGALVWLDGKPLVIDKRGGQAATALHASRVAPGPHTLEIKGDARYAPWAHRFVQEPGRTLMLHADLVPAREPTGSHRPSALAQRRSPSRASAISRRKVIARSTSAARQSVSQAEDPFESWSRRSALDEKKQVAPNAAEDIFESYGRRQGSAADGCIATISSRPWAEVSIDGKPTGQITPLVNYSLPCGSHRISFKNEDLMIERNERITLTPGLPFKKIFRLAETGPWLPSAPAM